MARNRLRMTSLRVLPKRMILAFPADDTTVSPEMPKQSLAFHSKTTNSCLASGGSREGTLFGDAPGQG
jgi:hypothetical protein